MIASVLPPLSCCNVGQDNVRATFQLGAPMNAKFAMLFDTDLGPSLLVHFMFPSSSI